MVSQCPFQDPDPQPPQFPLRAVPEPIERLWGHRGSLSRSGALSRAREDGGGGWGGARIAPRCPSPSSGGAVTRGAAGARVGMERRTRAEPPTAARGRWRAKDGRGDGGIRGRVGGDGGGGLCCCHCGGTVNRVLPCDNTSPPPRGDNTFPGVITAAGDGAFSDVLHM